MTETSGTYRYYTPDGPDRPRRSPLKAIIAPRPIAWVSTLSADGVGNLAPYSFFNMVNDRPPLLVFSSVGYKDSVRNISENPDFSVSIATRALAGQMNLTSQDHPATDDEFDLAGVPRRPSRAISAPGVDGSPAILECRAVEVRQLTGLDCKPLDTWLVIGQVLGVHLRDDCFVDGTFRTDIARPILRAGYADEYWEIGPEGQFRMGR